METIKGKKGFTLVELLIAMAILGVVLSAIYGVYLQTMKTSESQRLTADAQQSARAAIEYMTRDMALMGYDISNDCSPIPPATSCTGDAVANTPANWVADYDTGPKLSLASPSEIIFTYRDLSVGQARTVRYYMSGNTLMRDTRLYSAASTPPQWNSSTSDAVIDNVTNLNFTYYDGSGTAFSPASVSAMKNVRRVGVSVTARQSKSDPIFLTQKTYNLSTDIALINMGVSTAADSTPPPTPTLTAANAVNICGTLDVYWSASAAADLAGYVVQVTSGSQIRQFTALPTATSARIGGLRSSIDPATGLVTYFYPIQHNTPAVVQVRAFDTSGNYSPWSNSITRTPTADAPGQPAGLDASADTVNGSTVSLTWTPNSVTYNQCGVGQTNCDSDVLGYRVYRSEHGAGLWTQVANETTVTGASYTDNIAAGDHCKVFDYKIKAVNRCDTSLVSADSAVIYGDGPLSGGITDTPRDGVTNTRPADTTPPGAPTGAGPGNTVISKAGFRRNFINWNNPSDADLSYVAIRYNKALGSAPPYPSTPNDGTGAEDISGKAQASNVTGFAPGATGLGVIHTGSTSGTPSLLDSYTYAYSLFAVDRCGNVSTAAVTAQTTVNQCGEEITGPTAGAPRWASDAANFTVSNSCATGYTFSWNRIDDSATGIWDLAGYYAYRSTTGSFTYSSSDTKASSIILNPGSGLVSWSDLSGAGYTDDNTAYMGNTYKYYTIPLDCNRETNLAHNPWATVASSPVPSPLNSNVLTVTPGRVTFAKPVPPLVSYPLPANPVTTTGDLAIAASAPYAPSSATNYLHNTVITYIYNTSAGPVEMDSVTLSWNKPTAYLSEVRNTFNNACLFGACLGAAPAASPIAISAPVQLNGISGGTCPAEPCKLALKLIFTDSSGVPGAGQDMRNITVNVTNLQYAKTFGNNGLSFTTSCTMPAPVRFDLSSDNIPIPAGPSVLNGVSSPIQEVFGASFFNASQTPGGHNISSVNTVNVVAQVNDTGGAGISQAFLYYTYSSQNANTPPPLLGVTTGTPAGSTYRSLPMYELSAAGNIHTFAIKNTGTGAGDTIDGKKDKRVWYFILAKDAQGNWERKPEITDSVRAFTYDMDSACSDVPQAPTGPLSFTQADANLNTPPQDANASGSVTLSWTAPSFNTTGTTLTDLAGFTVYEETSTDRGNTWSFNNTPVATFIGTTVGVPYTGTFSPADASGTWVRYYVKAYDECPSPNYSSTLGPTSAIVKGTCSAPPSAASVDIASSTLALSGTINYVNTIVWAIPADNDLKLFTVYDCPVVGCVFSAGSNAGYTAIATVTITGTGATCSSTAGACSISGGKVTVTAPALSWNWTNNYWSVRATDFCNYEGNRGNWW